MAVNLMLVAVMLITVADALVGTCPQDCSCFLDHRGRREVLCAGGGLADPIPVLQMPEDVEILRVSAPVGSENALTLGPIFKGHRRLEELHVVNSGVPALGEHSLWGLRRLQVLNVSHNSIKALMDTNFRGAESLKKLVLSHNQIESVPSAVFRHVKLLTYLDLSHNKIPELVPRIFYGLKKLEVLNLSYNPLGNIEGDRFLDVPNLKQVRCIGCGLLEFPIHVFSDIQSLELLDLSSNRLTHMPRVKGVKSLVTLRLDDNHISVVTKDMAVGLPLKTFTISRNRLIRIEADAFRNSSITHLDISFNRLTHLEPKSLDSILSHIRYIHLSGNSLPIDDLLSLIPKARHLRHLGLSELGLTNIPPELLRNSKHLRHLNISTNYLSKFPHEMLYSTPHLQSIDLSTNSFRSLDEDLVTAFRAMASLNQVRLDGNPWMCESCYISAMWHWLTSSPRQPHSRSSCRKNHSRLCLICIGPEQLAGKELVLLHRKEIPKCRNESREWKLYGMSNGELVTQSDDPRFSVNHPREILGRKGTIATFFKDHLALLVGVGCGLTLALLLIVVVALVASRRHSAFYYTCEEDAEKKEKLMGRNNNESPVTKPAVDEALKIPPYEPMAISKVHAVNPIRGSTRSTTTAVRFASPERKPTIATIEEVNSITNNFSNT